MILTYIQEIDYKEYNDEYTSENGYGDVESYEMSMMNTLIKNRASQVENYVNVRVWLQINDNFEVKKYPEKELEEVRSHIIASAQESADRAEKTLWRNTSARNTRRRWTNSMRMLRSRRKRP